MKKKDGAKAVQQSLTQQSVLTLDSSVDEVEPKANKLVPDKLVNEENKQDGVNVTKLKQEFAPD